MTTMTDSLATLEITSPEAVTRLYNDMPSKEDVYDNGVDPTPATPADKNSVWFVLRSTSGLGAKLCQQMSNRAKPLSPKQWYWAVKIAGESLQPRQAPVSVDTTKAKEFFDNAISQRLRNPSVHIRLDDGSTVVVKRVGNRTRKQANIGTLIVTDDGGYPDNKFYGRIGHDGMLQPTRKSNAAVIAAILDFADDPATVAAEYGKLTGNCCFCRKALTDARSTDVGYGPVCARNWNLRWG